MGFLRGFIEFERIEQPHVPVEERVKSFCEIYGTLTDEQAKIQAGRCMDCGIPFCMHECPLHNDSPDFNEFVSEEQMGKAYNVLSATNNFPEITGRICPALCEEGCTLGIHRKAVGIKSVERKIAEYAFEHGLVKPVITEHRSGTKVCVVGSGPAALAAAQQLNRFGHTVTVVEKMNKIGGLLRYGIPDFKLPKEILDRRISQLEQEGITFKTSTIVGAIKNLEHGVHNDSLKEVRGQELLDNYDAIVLAPGSEAPRDLRLPGRDLKGIYFALDFLIAQNRENNGDCENPIDATAYNFLKERCLSVLNTLTKREKEVLMLRFGLENGYPHTLEEVGTLFQVTRERIRQIEAKALRKLRSFSRMRKLEGYLEEESKLLSIKSSSHFSPFIPKEAKAKFMDELKKRFGVQSNGKIAS